MTCDAACAERGASQRSARRRLVRATRPYAQRIVEVVAIVIAGAALLVSLATIYVTALQPADIILEYADEEQPVVRGPGFAGPVLHYPQSITIPVFAANVGNHGGVMIKIEVCDLVYEGADPPVWTGVGPTTHIPPCGYEAGDVKPGIVQAQLVGDPLTTPEQGAERVRGLTSIRVTVRWTFLRTPGPLKSLWRKLSHLPQPGSEAITRSFDVSLDCRAYKAEVLAHWRHWKEFHHLVELAGGRIET